MIVGSEPGWKEQIQGVPFVGPTGEELDRLLQLIGFPRALWALTNYFRRPAPRTDGKALPHPGEDFEEAGHHLKLELARVQPKLIVPLGREAIRYFLGDVDVDEVWGLHLRPPQDVLDRLPMLQPTVTIAPQVHPAAGFHSPEASNQVLRGFELLARILKGKTPPRYLYDDPIEDPNYRELFTADEFYTWANDPAAMLDVANDTEGSPRFPWSVQLTKSDGEGIILRTPEAIEAMREWAYETRPNFTFHSALYDARMNRIIGGPDVFNDGFTFDDTQLMAYELGVIPQGLKALAVRECAMPMLGYMEVLGDAQDRHARDYMHAVWNRMNIDYQRLRQWDFEFQTKKLGRRIKKLPVHPKPDLMKTAERVLSSKTPAKLWLDQTDDRQVEAFGLLRYEMPEASLSDVDPAVAIRYAGRDPDATRRVKKVLLPRLQEMGLESVYRLDLGTLPILDRMMAVGMLPDHEAFAKLARVLDDEIDNLRRKLIVDTGINNFNPNSGDQTATYVFDTLGLEMLGKRTDSGRGSTNDKVLEALEKMYPEYPAVADIRRYREYYKLRWTFCVAPDTRVLTNDMRWVPASTLAVGDGLLGFDENAKAGMGKRRAWKMTTIHAVERVYKPCSRLTFEDGTTLVCSDDHQWLARSRGSYAFLQWVRTDKLLAVDDIHAGKGAPRKYDYAVVKPLDVWTERPDRESGYLAGLFDGEGYIGDGGSGGFRATLSQNGGPILARAIKGLEERDYTDYSVSRINDETHTDHFKLSFLGFELVARLLGELRPSRLLTNLQKAQLPSMRTTRDVAVVKRESLGLQEVIALQTGTHTFVAEGFASHNCERLPELTNRWPFDERIHCELMLTRTPSGRLAAKNPNLLAMPKHGKYAKLFRACFIPREDCMFVSADESQVELRGLAHLSQDPVMCAIFRGQKRNPDGSLIDLHAATAQRIFGVAPKDQDESKHRLPAKAVNFGIPMGMTKVGLCLELQKGGVEGVTEDDAQRWIDETEAMFSEVPVYKQAMIAEAHKNGYVRCFSGRIRYVGGIRSKDDRVRAEAERFAFSTPIQEIAQAVGKRALTKAWHEVYMPEQKRGHYVQPLLWTHDDLLSEVEIPQVLRVARELKAILTEPPPGFSVPLQTTPEAGLNWSEMVKLS